jgi:hypothetical protein
VSISGETIWTEGQGVSCELDFCIGQKETYSSSWGKCIVYIEEADSVGDRTLIQRWIGKICHCEDLKPDGLVRTG